MKTRVKGAILELAPLFCCAVSFSESIDTRERVNNCFEDPYFFAWNADETVTYHCMAWFDIHFCINIKLIYYLFEICLKNEG